MKWSETNIKVRYQETDQMGVVYHANYFVWFEVGRTEMIRDIGISYRDMEEKGILLPVVDVSCKYIDSARYDDELIIRTKIDEYNGFRMNFIYEVIRKSDLRLLAKGETKHVWINKEYKPTRIDKITPDVDEKIRSSLFVEK